MECGPGRKECYLILKGEAGGRGGGSSLEEVIGPLLHLKVCLNLGDEQEGVERAKPERTVCGGSVPNLSGQASS